MHPIDESGGESFRIGAVSRLTSLSAHTLRKWEARYQALNPQRGEHGERLYTQEDIERLLLIKRLVDAGKAPREVAGLSHAELKRESEKLAAAESVAYESRIHAARAVIVGSGLAALFDPPDTFQNVIEVVASAYDAAALGHVSDEQIDVLICECPIVQPDTHRYVEALRARVDATVAVVIYEFGARDDIQTLECDWMTTVRAPADPRTLERAVTQIIGADKPPRFAAPAPQSEPELGKSVPPPRLPREVIARIAQEAPKIRCECPRHLADILLSLRAFEEYSAACESRSPEDAALHRYLWRSAAQARVLFEDAFERVAEAESIPLNR